MESIIFDLDGTLFDHAGAEIQAAQALHAEWEVFKEIPVGQFVHRWQLDSRDFYSKFTSGEVSFHEHRRLRVQSTWKWAGQSIAEAEAHTVFDRYLKHYEDHWRLFADALPCLHSLAGVRLGLITNGNPEHQKKKLRNCGIFELFDAVVVSEEVGCSKPSTEIFHLACERLGIAPSRCFYVGDNWEVDIMGAYLAGLRPIWINRTEERMPYSYLGIVPSLRDLTELGALCRAEVPLT